MASCIAGNAELRNNMSLYKEISFETAWLQLLKQTYEIMLTRARAREHFDNNPMKGYKT